MKRVSKLLSICLATLALAFLATGCKEDNKPRITRMNVSPACGVAPVEVIATAYVSGGDETGDPLGGNNGLDMTWNYGDGGTGSTSVVLPHVQHARRIHRVVVTATDPGGEAASASVPVTVLADSLVVVASTNFPDGTLTTDDIVQFDASVVSCDVDFPVVPGDAVKLAFRWEMNDATNRVFTGSSPDFKFVTAGEYDVELSVTYPAWAVTRHQTIHLSVSSNTSAK
jgi:hypothetical protein